MDRKTSRRYVDAAHAAGLSRDAGFAAADDELVGVMIEELPARSGAVVPYRTLHRFAVGRCGFRVKTTTVRVDDGEPGVE